MNSVRIKRSLWAIKMYSFRLESKNTSPQDFSQWWHWESSVRTQLPSREIKGNLPVTTAVCLFNNCLPVRKVMDLWVHDFQQTPVLGIGGTLICTIARRTFAQQMWFCQILSAALLCTIYSSLCSVIVTPCSLMQFLLVTKYGSKQAKIF